MMHISPLNTILTIAGVTFYEGVKNRLFIFTVAVILSLFLLGEFVGELAIIEAREVQSGVYAFTLRIFLVLITGIFVISSMVREFNDKSFEVVLSLPIKRSTYYFGKVLGFYLLSGVLVVLILLPLLLYADYLQVLIWSMSLFCESMIIVSISLLCLFTFGNITVALIFVIGFYLLSRTIDVINLISNSPILESHGLAHEISGHVIEGISVLLPDLYLFTRTSWLIYGDGSFNDVLFFVIQTIIYVAFISFAGLFDLYRKNL